MTIGFDKANASFTVLPQRHPILVSSVLSTFLNCKSYNNIHTHNKIDIIRDFSDGADYLTCTFYDA
jgi:hypothetical protein